MNKCSVSIVMPSFNAAETISASINSVLEQSYEDWELIVVDDCSSDGTADIARQFANRDRRIIVLTNDVNFGAGFSRNKAIGVSSGKYISFLDADDVWIQSKLAKQVRYMEKTGALFTYTAYQKFSDSGLGGVIIPPIRVTHNQLLYGNVIGCLTVMFNAEVLGRQTMPLIRKRQDMGLWLKLLKICEVAHGIPEVLACYRIDSGMTQNKLSAAMYQWRLYRQVVGLGVFKCAWYFSWYVLNGFSKYFK